MENENSVDENVVGSPVKQKSTPVSDEQLGNRTPREHESSTPISGSLEGNVPSQQKADQQKESTGLQASNFLTEKNMDDTPDFPSEEHENEIVSKINKTSISPNLELANKITELQSEESSIIPGKTYKGEMEGSPKSIAESTGEITNVEVGTQGVTDPNEIIFEEEPEPVFDGTEVPGMEPNMCSTPRSSDSQPDTRGYAWPDTAVSVTKFLRQKSVAVSNVLRRLSGKSDDGNDISGGEDEIGSKNTSIEDTADSSGESEAQGVSQKTAERSAWNPLSLIGISREIDNENKVDKKEDVCDSVKPRIMKGHILLYTRLGCQDCKEMRMFLQRRRLRFTEVNVDVYPGRKSELEKLVGSSAVPVVFLNEIVIRGLNELRSLDDSGGFAEKIEYVVSEAPSFEAPLPPLSGEGDLSSSGALDELALIVRKMKNHIGVKDRFYKMRWFTNCFLGSEAVDFLSEDQYLEREEAIEFGRKLASKLFFQHVLDENVFEDGNHLYRFLDDDPIVAQCQNIPRGIIEAKPKPITAISSRLRFLFYAILEAYTSEDGRHVDYRSIHGSEEFARYLRIAEELQRVELQDMPREEKLSLFINLYNMMAIHAVLVWGHPSGPLERRKLFGEFKYVIGGCTFSLSAIYNGILRANQRPPYNLIKPFGIKDKRLKLVLPYPEPLVHFALVNGSRSGPALQCYSPGDIDKELINAAHNFLRCGGLVVDLQAKVAYVSKILKWYSSDFGKNETEVLKHAANYLETEESQSLLELLATTQLKVVYQPYDWGLNN